MNFDYKDPNEIDYFTVDFVDLLSPGEYITQASTSISVLNGSDPGYEGLLFAQPIIDKTKIKQLLHNGIINVTYELSYVATTNLGNILEQATEFTVRQRSPLWCGVKLISTRVPISVTFELPETDYLTNVWVSSVVVLDGSDPNPTLLLYGTPLMQGNTLFQILTAGQDQTDYQITFMAQTTKGSTKIAYVNVPVRAS